MISLPRRTAGTPDIDFTGRDGVRHTSWAVADAAGHSVHRSSSSPQIPFLYIADGHHRSAAAARVYQARKGSGPQRAFSRRVIFPHNQMQILPYNRVLKDLNGLTPGNVAGRSSSGVFSHPSNRRSASPRASTSSVCYLAGKWHTLTFRPELTATHDPIESLDVTLLQKHVLAPIFGIDDPRTSKRDQLCRRHPRHGGTGKAREQRRVCLRLLHVPDEHRGFDGHCRRRRHHAAQEHLVRAEAARRDVLPPLIGVLVKIRPVVEVGLSGCPALTVIRSQFLSKP